MTAIALLVVLAVQEAAVRPLPDRTRCRAAIAARPWARDLRQIPSTVIDKGFLRNVPYTSYRAGYYELNVYGDPAAPAGFELGVLADLARSAPPRMNCLEAVSALLPDPEDRKLLASLKLEADRKTRAGLTLEITPPTAEDAYGGWWVSVYDEAALERSRATPQELARLTTMRKDVIRADAEKRDDAPLPVDAVTEGRWAAEDLEHARKRPEVAEERQAVYKPVYSRKDGAYVPDRTIDDTGHILFICAGSDKHEDREEIIKACPACTQETSTFFWDAERKSFICFQCGRPYDNARITCSLCGKVPRRVRTKHR